MVRIPQAKLYEIVICIHFYLESHAFSWKLLNEEKFPDSRFTLDNMRKQHTAEGVGVTVKKAQILSNFDEDLLWNIGLLGVTTPSILLNIVVFLVGKG